MGRHSRVTGRHRAPSTTGRTAARVIAAGVAAASPLTFTGSAVGAERMPDNVREAIVSCESGGNPKAQSPVSSASGAYQFIRGTWLGFGGGEFASTAAQATRAEQDIVADRAFAVNGTRDWEADPRSEACWKPKIGQEVSRAVSTPPRQAAPDSAPVGERYRIVCGDTLARIAVAHGTTVTRLADVNNIPDPDRIFAGDFIRV